jgi:hypothetical protein
VSIEADRVRLLVACSSPSLSFSRRRKGPQFFRKTPEYPLRFTESLLYIASTSFERKEKNQMSRQGNPNEKEGPPERPLALPCRAQPRQALPCPAGPRRPSLVLLQGANPMTRQVTKPNIFWAPSLETARKIDDHDTIHAIETAKYRFAASMSDLERCYDAEASKLRAAFVAEVAQLYQDSEAV